MRDPNRQGSDRIRGDGRPSQNALPLKILRRPQPPEAGAQNDGLNALIGGRVLGDLRCYSRSWVYLRMHRLATVQTITTHFTQQLCGDARCLLPALVKQQGRPCRCGLVPSFTAGRLPARVSGGKKRMGLRLLIQRLGRQVDAARPDDRPGLRIDRDLSEVSGVVLRREDARPPFTGEVDIPGSAVAEQQAEHAVTDHGDTDDDRQLREDGPSLGRPLVDRLKGSRIHHLKELRPGSRGRSEIRIIFAFDPARSALLLLGDDKAGNWERWYRDNVPVAERLYLDYTTEGEQ